MAISKHMLILANSIKHYPSVCIAGREINSTGQRYEIGPWIRPVSDHNEGALAPNEVRLKQKRPPRVFDFVEIGLSQKCVDPLQPENWLIEPGNTWTSVNGSYERPTLESLVEQPNEIWLARSERSDRITSNALKRLRPSQSLYLVHIPQVNVSLGWRQWDGQYKARRRAIFTYNGVEYDLGITDPIFLEKYRGQYPAKGERPNVFSIGSGNGVYLCVSLAPEFNGYHYKVAATIFES